MFCLIRFCTGLERQVPNGGDPADCSAALAGEMSGSMPEPDVVTASTGMSPIVRPGLYGPSSLRIAVAAAVTFFARSGFVGPRLANVVPPAL